MAVDSPAPDGKKAKMAWPIDKRAKQRVIVWPRFPDLSEMYPINGAVKMTMSEH